MGGSHPCSELHCFSSWFQDGSECIPVTYHASSLVVWGAGEPGPVWQVSGILRG